MGKRRKKMWFEKVIKKILKDLDKHSKKKRKY